MPIITISRQYAAGGSTIAARIAETLGWDLLDNEVVDEVAARTGLTADEAADRVERRPSFSERLASAMTMSTQEMLSPLAAAKLPPSENYVLEVTRHVIEEAAERGPVVIVGRGAHLMLGSRSDVFSAFCYAPTEALVRYAMQRDSLPHDAAGRKVEAINRQRQGWVNAHWGRDWMSPTTYHVCVDTDALGFDGAADTIIQAARFVLGDTLETAKGRSRAAADT